MGLICYVLYLPVKELAYYLNTGSLASDSMEPQTVPPSFAFLCALQPDCYALRPGNSYSEMTES